MTWDYPILVVGTFIAAMAIALSLMRAGHKKAESAFFACAVCGRRTSDREAKNWHYCPYCGVPRGARSLRHRPKERRSIVDMK